MESGSPMDKEQDKKLYDTLTRTGELLKNVAPVEGEEYSVDAILAEFGRGAVSCAQKEEDSPAPAPAVPEPPAPEPPPPEDNMPPDRVSLRDMMESTVDAVLAENDDGILAPPRPLRERLRDALPRRHKKKGLPQDTEELWSQPEPEPEEPPEEPEPEPEEAYRAAKRQARHLRRGVTLLLFPAVLSVMLTAAEGFALLPALWHEDHYLHGGITAGLCALALLLAGDVWRSAARQLRARRASCELGALLAALVTTGYSVWGLFNGFSIGEPFTAANCLLLWLCQEGLYLEAEARLTAYALVNIGGQPPYTVSATPVGTCKQRGTLRGFYRSAEEPDPARTAQSYAIPLLLAAATVLTGVVCLADGMPDKLLWVWSAMLTAAVPLSLPLGGALPLLRLQKRLRAGGSAVAGWAGARDLRSKRRLVVTESDLFPPGTVEFNGYRVFGEERRKMISYAATVAQAAGSQLTDLFLQQLAAEGGMRYRLEELQFYEEGGVGGTIRGESVLMGSAYFMKQKHIALPHDLKLQTGVFLAVDGVLGAIFVIKYQPSRNVEWALRALGRAHIRPILAVRSGNVTPGLLRRKFRLDAHPIYPDVGTRIALSDTVGNTGARANAVLYREGLMPLAETVVGAGRLRSIGRTTLLLTYLGAAAGLFLCYYFTHAGAFYALTPLYMLGFLLLWLLPTVLLSGLVKHF